MTTQTIEPAPLAKLAEAGGNFSVSVLADRDGWTVCVHDEAGEYVLVDQIGKLTVVFDALEAVEQHLRALGIVQFEVDGRMDRDSDDPAHDAWFRAQVREALNDPSSSIPHDAAMRMLRAAINLSKAPSPNLPGKVSHDGFGRERSRSHSVVPEKTMVKRLWRGCSLSFCSSCRIVPA